METRKIIRMKLTLQVDEIDVTLHQKAGELIEQNKAFLRPKDEFKFHYKLSFNSNN